MTFTVLTVCTANICRSPLMALSLEHSLMARGFGADVVVRSAGVRAVAGQAVCPEIAALARSRGLPWLALEQHRATPLTDELIDRADLILTADRGLRSDIVKRARPLAIGRTFSLREAAQLADPACHRIAGSTLEERLLSLTTQMNHGRGFTDLPAVERMASRALPWRRLQVHSHDVPDAHGQPRATHSLVYRLVNPTADQLAASLATGALAHLR